MTEKDLLSALSDVDEGYVEHAATALEGRGGGRRRRILQTVIALAAALCLLIAGTVGVALSVREPDGTATESSSFPLPLLTTPHHSGELSGKQYVSLLEGSSLSTDEAEYPDPVIAYREAYVITARVIEVLPDVYSRTPYAAPDKILRLQVLDVLNGANMPEEIYFLFPAEYMIDFSPYSEIVFAMQQLGIENFLLYNQTDRCVESFSLLFDFWTHPIHTPNGAMIPFTDGTPDLRLWENENWRYGAENALEVLKTYTGKTDCTPEEFKAGIRAQTRYPDCPVRTQASFDFDAARTVFAYVEPYINGTFMQEESDPGDPPLISYIRLINGFRTEERIVMNGEKQTVTDSGVRYTAEDLQSVPDIGALIEILEQKNLTPPHLDTDGLEMRGGQITGWYRKVNGKVYGIVKAEWLFFEPRQRQYYRDDLYFLATPDGTYRKVSREELRSVIGEDHYIDTYPHGSRVEVYE
ncbi:MAG: hypothetical protein IJW98_08370 [Clostridia bacterium]|nr:hypothetical protein [Clostridia bacterium]